MAEGVLPVCLGQATRVVEYMMDARKTYVGRIHFGLTSDTYDSDGTVVARADASRLQREDIEAALRHFVGEIEQRPPAFSALKRQGVPLYELARRGKVVEVSPRRVRIHSLTLVAWEPPIATVEVVCGRGTYIRSLAHDLGQELGVGGLLEGLVRNAVGPFTIERSVTLSRLERDFEDGTWQEHLIALDEAMLDWPAAVLGPLNARRIATGRPPVCDLSRQVEGLVRAYTTEGDFLAVMRGESGGLKPVKVFAPAGTYTESGA